MFVRNSRFCPTLFLLCPILFFGQRNLRIQAVDESNIPIDYAYAVINTDTIFASKAGIIDIHYSPNDVVRIGAKNYTEKFLSGSVKIIVNETYKVVLGQNINLKELNLNKKIKLRRKTLGLKKNNLFASRIIPKTYTNNAIFFKNPSERLGLVEEIIIPINRAKKYEGCELDILVSLYTIDEVTGKPNKKVKGSEQRISPKNKRQNLRVVYKNKIRFPAEGIFVVYFFVPKDKNTCRKVSHASYSLRATKNYGNSNTFSNNYRNGNLWSKAFKTGTGNELYTLDHLTQLDVRIE